MDAYEYKARLAPITVVSAPFLALGTALLGAGAWRFALAIFVGVSGLHLLFMQFVRDRGYARQPQLFARWGGSPTVKLLRWSETTNPLLVKQRHRELTRVTGIPLPAATEEAADPTSADNKYEAAVAVLRDRTRTEGFDLVSRQNANYGYRRNLFGCRLIGVSVAVGTVITGVCLTFLPQGETAAYGDAWLITASLFASGWIIMWVFAITEDFVRRAADQYANALIEAAGRAAAA